MTKDKVMSVLDQVRIVIYRFHEKGLEVFLLNSTLEEAPDVWKLPSGSIREQLKQQIKGLIQLDDVQNEVGEQVPIYAIEADWHEIPSVRGMIKHDVKRLTRKINSTLPDIEHGTYFCVKEAFKKTLPNEYKAVKELKDILLDRNLLTNI